MSPPITRKFPKSDQKKNTLSTRGMSKMEFLTDFWPWSTGIFSHFSGIFGGFSCFYVVLACVSLVFWHAQFIVCTIWTYKRALCMRHMYIATKSVFALITSVWCVCVGHSSRAQCASFFVFFAIRMQDPRLSEKQKKSALTNCWLFRLVCATKR